LIKGRPSFDAYNEQIDCVGQAVADSSLSESDQTLHDKARQHVGYDSRYACER
jgi:hypothetical protein